MSGILKITQMGLFDIFRKKVVKEEEDDNNRILLSMAMYNNQETFNHEKVIAYLQTEWNAEIAAVNGDSKTITFSLNGETVALATIGAQIPWGDIKGAAQYAYNWPDAEEALKDHDSHVIITLMSGEQSVLDRFRLFTMLNDAVVATSNAIGIYMGSQSLLIPKEQYQEGANGLKQNLLPVDLWVYIGLRSSENGNSLYTYGLKAFDKTEMEIINSSMNLEELYNFLMNICAYVIGKDITFKAGETLGYTAEQKINISLSKGIFVEGKTLKLEM